MEMNNQEKAVRRKVKHLFDESQVLTNRQVANYLELVPSVVRQHALNGSLVPIMTIGRGKTHIRLYYYPDIVLFKQYLREKRKNQGYDAYHKQIHTLERKKIQELLQQTIWTSEQVCEYLDIHMNVLNGIVTRRQLEPIFVLNDRNARLFFVLDVKLFRIDYKAYQKFKR